MTSTLPGVELADRQGRFTEMRRRATDDPSVGAGAGRRAVDRAVARARFGRRRARGPDRRALGWRIYDREILAAVAAETRRDELALERFDEKGVREFGEYIAPLIVPDDPGQARVPRRAAARHRPDRPRGARGPRRARRELHPRPRRAACGSAPSDARRAAPRPSRMLDGVAARRGAPPRRGERRSAADVRPAGLPAGRSTTRRATTSSSTRSTSASPRRRRGGPRRGAGEARPLRSDRRGTGPGDPRPRFRPDDRQYACR